VDDERVQALLPFTEREQRWLRETWRQGGDPPQTVLLRIDTNVDLADDEWDDEPSVFGVGLGGMGGDASGLLMREVVPVLQRAAPALVVKAQEDVARQASEQLAVHAAAIRRRADEIVARDEPMQALIAREDRGEDLSALKQAFLDNRVVSSVAADFLMASAFEVLTTPELAAHFTQRQQRLFRHHVPWTRLVRDAASSDPDGAPIALLPWLRRHKDELVLKPNRGGEAVLGPHVDLAQWDDALAHALAHGYVAQRYVPIHVTDFPLLGADGIVALEQLYVTCSFLATDRGVHMLGHASKRRSMRDAQAAGILLLG
jgi:hypothetical protein